MSQSPDQTPADTGPRPARRASVLQRSPLLGAIVEVASVLATALVLSFLVKTFLVQAFYIPSGSMEDTLLVNDRVLVSKLTPRFSDVHRGDVIVFKDPGGWLPPVEKDDGVLRTVLTLVGLLPADSGEHLVKRVIGTPGDHVVCCDAEGKITVNGVAITEPYVRDGQSPSGKPFDVTVKADHLWVMGDNRSESADSRSHLSTDDGQVPIDRVVGKAFVIVWPLDRFGGIGGAGDTFAKVPAPAAS